jgi:hypothetical protein
MTTQFGSMMLVQTDKPVIQPTRAYTDAQELANGYRDQYSWLETPAHTDWHDLTDFSVRGKNLDYVDPVPVAGGAS